MSSEFKTLGEGYLYNLWNGKLKEMKGEVFHRDKYSDGQYIFPEDNYFRVIDENGRRIKTLCCSSMPEVIYNKGVWLEKSDPEKAAQILIEYEETQIAKLKLKIENHESIIETLKKELRS